MFYNPNKDNEHKINRYLQETGSEMVRWSLFNSTKIKNILVTFTDLDNKKNEISVSRDAIGDKFISVYFAYTEDFEINYPQQIILKFVTEEALYIIETELKDIIREKNIIYFTIKSPPQIERRQRRAYFRLNLVKNIIIFANDVTQEDGMLMSLAKIVNLSAGGVKVGRIEKLFPDDKKDSSNIKLSMYKNFYLILVLNSKTLIRLKAKFARYEQGKDGKAYYCFEFVDTPMKDIDTISKFIIVEQVNQHKLERESKEQYLKELNKKRK